MYYLGCYRVLQAKSRLFSSSRLRSNVTPVGNVSSTGAPAGQVLALSKDFVGDRLKKFMEWYEDVTGIREVRISQDKVLKAEDRFIAAQDARREISKQLAVVRDRLKDIYAELDQTSRGEDRYVLLITQEHKVLKDERRLADLFNQCEQEERENFSMLSSAVKESHEKERIQAERTKYWSIIGSIVGTMIGIAGSSINNEFKMRELRKLVRESAQANILSRQEVDAPSNLGNLVQKIIQEQNVFMAAIQENHKEVRNLLCAMKQSNTGAVHSMSEEFSFDTTGFLEAQRRESRILAAVCLSSVIGLCLFTKMLN